MTDSNPKIFPRCKLDMDSVYVSAEGIVFPCCWLGNMPHAKSYAEFHGNTLAQLNVKNHDLADILRSPEFLKVEQSWAKEPLLGCREHCGKPPQLALDEMDGTNRVRVIQFSSDKI